MYSIGVDLGATKTNFVLLSRNKILKTDNCQTSANQRELLEGIEETVKRMIAGVPKSKIKGLGIGVPGPLNEKRTMVLNPPNLPAFSNFPLAAALQKRLKLKTKMENDGNCFALAEASMGAAKNAKVVLGLTLGSGVGGGIVMGGKIHKGAFGAAAEVGHITINYNGLKCSCGGTGCLEEYASQRFFLRKGAYPLAFQKKAEKGDKRALNVYREYGQYLGAGISSCINLLDPDAVVLGGGMSEAYRFFIDSVKKEVAQRVISPQARKYVNIKKAELLGWSGAVGAALLVQVN